MESGLKRLLIIIGIIILFAFITTIWRIHRVKKNYQSRIQELETALESWGAEFPELLPKKNGESITIPLRTLKQSGYIKERFMNPKKKELFSNQLLMRITKEKKNYRYQVLDQDRNMIEDFEGINQKAPMILLNGNEIEYAELNRAYEDLGYEAITMEGKKEDDIKIEITTDGKAVKEIDTSKLRTYQITYIASYAKESSSITRTVIVKDTEEPTITMDRLTLHPNEVEKYDLLDGVKLEDNSKSLLHVKIEGSLAAVPGRYVLTYQVADESRNVEEKKRVVRVEE